MVRFEECLVNLLHPLGVYDLRTQLSQGCHNIEKENAFYQRRRRVMYNAND